MCIFTLIINTFDQDNNSTVIEMLSLEFFVHIMWIKWKDVFPLIGNFHYNITM